MDTFISKGPESTQALGALWGREATPGWVVALSGDLGSGKTQLVKGLAQGLGSTDPVRSPTFALLNEYGGGRLPLYHLDLYRLNDTESIFRAGLSEYLIQQTGLTAVEWAERWWESEAGHGNIRLRRVWIDVINDSERRITYEDLGT
jgi:tRNA threonylcarbamoyladenosine biosynthesis protein TsaE